MKASIGWLLALDPGVNAGVAAFFMGELVGARVVSAPSDRDKKRPDLNAIHTQARVIQLWFADLVAARAAPHFLACEWPKLYEKDRSSRKDYNDFLGLTALDGAVRYAIGPTDSETVFPSEWKGQLSGDDESIVRERVRSRLVGPELGIADNLHGHKAHNGWDAIGIGLHVLGRGLVNDRVRKYPR